MADKEHDKHADAPAPKAPKPAEKEPPAKGTQSVESPVLPPDFYMTEQEKAGQQAPVADEAPKKKETK